MTDAPDIDADTKRLAALQALAQANLVRKAKEGKTLTAADWTELRRMMVAAGLAQVPWLHETLTELATALGISVRTLENWRPRGAPIPPDGPWDELAVRLWVNAESASGKRMGKLADPSPALAGYLTLAAKARTAKPAAPRDNTAGLKRRQEQMLEIKISERQKIAQQQATDLFLAVLGRLDQLWEREVGSQLPQQLWGIAQTTNAQAVPALQRKLRERFASIRSRALTPT
jgi:hypothetical protein